MDRCSPDYYDIINGIEYGNYNYYNYMMVIYDDYNDEYYYDYFKTKYRLYKNIIFNMDGKFNSHGHKIIQVYDFESYFNDSDVELSKYWYWNKEKNMYWCDDFIKSYEY